MNALGPTGLQPGRFWPQTNTNGHRLWEEPPDLPRKDTRLIDRSGKPATPATRLIVNDLTRYKNSNTAATDPLHYFQAGAGVGRISLPRKRWGTPRSFQPGSEFGHQSRVLGLMWDASCRRDSASFNHKGHIEHKAWDATAAGLERFGADRAEVPER